MSRRKRDRRPVMENSTEPPQEQAVEVVATVQMVETDFAVEWGEGILTGRVIARGGCESGFVPGATDLSSMIKPAEEHGPPPGPQPLGRASRLAPDRRSDTKRS
jgi:hypothetical protein